MPNGSPLPNGPDAQGPAGPEPSEVAEELPTTPPAPRTGARLRWAVPDSTPRPGASSPAPSLPSGAPPAGHVTTQLPRVPPPPSGPLPGSLPWGPAGVGPPDGDVLPTEAGVVADASQRAPRRRRWWWPALLAMVVVALAAGVVAGVRAASGPGPAATFEGLLRTSAEAHHLVGEAVAAACAHAGPELTSRRAALGQLEEAVSLRSSVLRSLSADASLAGRLDDGRALFSELGSVTRASLEADRDYESWLSDLQATGCYGAPTNDVNYEAAASAAGRAIGATAALEATWARVAPRYKLPAGLAAQA